MRTRLIVLALTLLYRGGITWGGTIAAGDPQQAVDRINAFGRLLTVRQEHTGNYADGPLSQYRALAMTWAGTRSATADQIARVLQADADPSALWPDLGALSDLLRQGTGEAAPISNAERLWIQADYKVLPSYLAFLRQRNVAEPGQADFARNPDDARETLNHWAASVTHDRVTELFPVGAFSTMTRVVLVSTVHFRGTWATRFDPVQTKDQPFLGRSGVGLIPLMHRTGRFTYAEERGLQIIEVPFSDYKTTMVIILPAPGQPDQAKQALLSGPIESLLAQAQSREVDVYLPRFSVETSADLSSVLADMGMPAAFSRADADFSGMSPRNDLYLSSVFQRVSLQVSEDGAEAAAAGGVVIVEKGAPTHSSPPVIFRADRPFFFFIRDSGTGLIYFSGCLANAPARDLPVTSNPTLLIQHE